MLSGSSGMACIVSRTIDVARYQWIMDVGPPSESSLWSRSDAGVETTWLWGPADMGILNPKLGPLLSRGSGDYQSGSKPETLADIIRIAFT